MKRDFPNYQSRNIPTGGKCCAGKSDNTGYKRGAGYNTVLLVLYGAIKLYFIYEYVVQWCTLTTGGPRYILFKPPPLPTDKEIEGFSSGKFKQMVPQKRVQIVFIRFWFVKGIVFEAR